ncbi:MAG TPA: peptide deformylase [Trueperaceae bacterium]|nr:peptide deformylase [Trueperaceae bacterium]HRP47753.1 peptide deformylase [Trueperaceae bacterium]
MIHPIRLFGDPVLRRRALPVTNFDERLKTLAADMFETMYAAEGVGLAAPQIGVSRRMFVALELPTPADDDDEDDSRWDQRVEHVIINPLITRRAGVQLARDGCLSLPGLTALDVPRDLAVDVTYQDLAGATHTISADGYFAHVLQHEFDHLEGVLYYDHLPEPRRQAFLEEHRRELVDMQRRAKAALREDRAAVKR